MTHTVRRSAANLVGDKIIEMKTICRHCKQEFHARASRIQRQDWICRQCEGERGWRGRGTVISGGAI